VFSAAMWERWLSERAPDTQTQHLKAGIDEFRSRVVVGKEVRP
jgi:hypothetical protein